MDGWKRLLLQGYYYGTLPGRRLGMLRIRQPASAPLVVLFYHRVADEHPNDWSITRSDFQRQMLWLQEHVDLITLKEMQLRMRNGPNARAAVSITFDDGYAENCQFALPWLLEQGIPVTYFVTTRNVATGEPFPHDVARACPLSPNSVQEIKDLAAAGIEIGAHSRTHLDLGAIHDVDRLYDEVVASREELQEWIGRPVRYFAFPFGQHVNLNPLVFELARAAGFEAVCSAYGGYNLPGDSPFHIQRIHGDPEFLRFRCHVDDDPRQRFKPRYPVPSTWDCCEPLTTHS